MSAARGLAVPITAPARVTKTKPDGSLPIRTQHLPPQRLELRPTTPTLKSWFDPTTSFHPDRRYRGCRTLRVCAIEEEQHSGGDLEHEAVADRRRLAESCLSITPCHWRSSETDAVLPPFWEARWDIYRACRSFNRGGGPFNETSVCWQWIPVHLLSRPAFVYQNLVWYHSGGCAPGLESHVGFD